MDFDMHLKELIGQYADFEQENFIYKDKKTSHWRTSKKSKQA